MSGSIKLRGAALALAYVVSAILSPERAGAQASPQTAAAPPDEDVLQEVLVTAERHESAAQRTGVSLAVLDGAELLNQGRSTTTQILETVPNVTLFQGSSSAASTIGSDNQGSNIVIRGIPPNNIPTGGVLPTVPTVAVYTEACTKGSVTGTTSLA